MSASDKKKLRKEAQTAALTEKQKKQISEAKKLKRATFAFVAIMLAVVLVAGWIFGSRAYKNSGFVDRKTTAAVTSSGHEINSVLANYYFIDYVRNMYLEVQNTYGDSAQMYVSYILGLDVNSPLNTQMLSADSNKTQADYYLDAALTKAKNDLALRDKAEAEGFQLPEEDRKAIESNEQMLELYATVGGYKSVDKYLQAMYGNGADLESYNEYVELTSIAAAYYSAYSDSIEVDDAAIREYEKDKYDQFSSFTYASYTVKVSDYLTGGTENADGSKTYTEEERAAAQEKAAADVETLKTADSMDAFDAAIAALAINADAETAAASTKNDVVMYDQLPSEDHQKWLATAKVGEIKVLETKVSSTDADGVAHEEISTYEIIYFMERNDNTQPMANVRHLLIKFEGGTTDSTGNTVYSQAEKDAAKQEAERLLQVWKDGEATEESFIALVKEYTDDTASAETGGLYEDINPGSSYVESFLAWSTDSARQVGDTGVIVTEYGYHVMYFSSYDEMNYRDFMISEELHSQALDNWYTGITEATTFTLKNTKRLKLDVILANLG